MKRTMYQAARHTPKDEAGGSNPFKRAIIMSKEVDHCTAVDFFCVFCILMRKYK